MNNVAYTANGAVSLASTGNAALDYFSKAGTYRGRDDKLVAADMEKIFKQDPLQALKLVFGVRLITRIPKGEEVVATGMGQRDETIRALIWLHNNMPEHLYANLHLVPLFGSWRDFFDPKVIQNLDNQKLFELIAQGLEVEGQTDLIKKFLPQIRMGKKVRSERDKIRSQFAEKLRLHLGLTPKAYRKLKASGAAHIWQKQMSNREWDKINPEGIPGKAMLIHTTRKGKDGKTVFERHNQENRILEWALSKETIKFTGFPYEITKKALELSMGKIDVLQRAILERQFQLLLDQAGNHSYGNLLPVVDGSGSMASLAMPGVTAQDIAVSLAMVFSSLNTGYFKDQVCKFDRTSSMHKLSGGFFDRVQQLYRLGCMGNTNFQSVIDMLVNMRKMLPNVPVSEYPKVLLVISDMQMDPTNREPDYYSYSQPDKPRNLAAEKTNFQAMQEKLRSVGLEGISTIWWRVAAPGAGTSNITEFQVTSQEQGTAIISGFNPLMLNSMLGISTPVAKSSVNSIVTEANEAPKVGTPEDAMNSFLNQDVFRHIKLGSITDI